MEVPVIRLLALAVLGSSVAFGATPSWSSLSSDSGWTSDSDNSTSDAGSVHVDSKQIEGVPCFRATATTDVSPAKLLAVAQDVEGSTKWSSAGVTEAKVLESSGGKMQYYQYLDVPGWTMASDRFWFLQSTYTTSDTGAVLFRWDRLVDGGTYKATWDSVKSAHPDAVEPPVNTGAWMFTPKDGKTEVRYFICTDSGGSIPAFVQTAATRKTLPDTLSDLIREAKNR